MKFLGFQKPDEIFPKLGLTVLTSISEALPLVVLESFASGVPVVATDVGLLPGADRGAAARGPGAGPGRRGGPDRRARAGGGGHGGLLRDPGGLVPGARGRAWNGCSAITPASRCSTPTGASTETALEAAGGRNRVRAS